MNTESGKKPSPKVNNPISLNKLANRNFMLSLVLFVILISIIFFASLRDSAHTNQLMGVYDDQFKVSQLKASISDVMVPINDFTMTADTNNFAKIRQSIKIFKQRYESIKSITHLTSKDHQSLDQMNSLMSEVLNIANDVADGNISSAQAPQVAVLAQNLVLSSQRKLIMIVKAMEEQLKKSSIQREQQAQLQLYVLLGFIVFIILLLEVLNRKLVAHAQTVSKVSSDVAESASDIIEVNKMQTAITEQQSRFMDKVIKGLALIEVSGAKIPVAASALEKNSSVISSFAKGGAAELAEISQSMHRTRSSIAEISKITGSVSASEDQVLQALERIREVADEANLLALNASIDGDSSITHDVLRMADQIRGFTQDIQTSLKPLATVSADTIKAAEVSVRGVEDINSTIEATSDMLQRIENLSNNNGQSAALVVEALALQNARNKKILHVLKHISELLHSSDNKLQAYKDASSRLTEASESLQHMT